MYSWTIRQAFHPFIHVVEHSRDKRVPFVTWLKTAIMFFFFYFLKILKQKSAIQPKNRKFQKSAFLKTVETCWHLQSCNSLETPSINVKHLLTKIIKYYVISTTFIIIIVRLYVASTTQFSWRYYQRNKKSVLFVFVRVLFELHPTPQSELLFDKVNPNVPTNQSMLLVITIYFCYTVQPTYKLCITLGGTAVNIDCCSSYIGRHHAYLWWRAQA